MTAPRRPLVLAVHGGAGKPPASEAARQGAERALSEALRAGWEIISAGGSALDAVEAAVAAMEASGCFNAGRGAVTDRDGGVTLDASIMDGATRRVGAVAAMGGVTSAIRAARLVMEQTPHVLLAGEGAERFARGAGVPPAPPGYFLGASERAGGGAAPAPPPSPGTVGAVARDEHGRFAAATSTGGVVGKWPGRVGDSAIAGAGTWADDVCAVSATGTGEMFIRVAFARQVAWRVAERGQSLEAAARGALADVDALGGAGGCIAIDTSGRVAMPFSTPVMYRGWVAPSEDEQPPSFRPCVGIFPEDL